jgi:hypothetical protein
MSQIHNTYENFKHEMKREMDSMPVKELSNQIKSYINECSNLYDSYLRTYKKGNPIYFQNIETGDDLKETFLEMAATTTNVKQIIDFYDSLIAFEREVNKKYNTKFYNSFNSFYNDTRQRLGFLVRVIDSATIIYYRLRYTAEKQVEEEQKAAAAAAATASGGRRTRRSRRRNTKSRKSKSKSKRRRTNRRR